MTDREGAQVPAEVTAAKQSATVDVLLVSLGSTAGLRAVDAELAESLRRAGASVVVVSPQAPRELRTLALIDLSWALGARRAAQAELARRPVGAVIYSSTTAALLWPCPGAIRFDALAAGNRRGRHGLWQRPLERRRLATSPLLLPQSEGALHEVRAISRHSDRALVIPVAIERSGPLPLTRDITAITYAANPRKKGLDRVLEAWQQIRRDSEELVVCGVARQSLVQAGISVPEQGVRVTGLLTPDEYRALLRRSRVFVCAPRREDYGVAQLEALADGCQLVSTQAPGPYAALPIARELDPRLVGEDLGSALRNALDDPRADYTQRAQLALVPFSREAVDQLVAGQLLARLLAR
jgi:glycosyltransferase involved in cell wall biosynthesis